MSRFYRGGAAPALKPEGAIKRADELLSVGQKQNALQTLHDTITNKRQQRNWTKALEQVRDGAGHMWGSCWGSEEPSSRPPAGLVHVMPTPSPLLPPLPRLRSCSSTWTSVWT